MIVPNMYFRRYLEDFRKGDFTSKTNELLQPDFDEKITLEMEKYVLKCMKHCNLLLLEEITKNHMDTIKDE